MTERRDRRLLVLLILSVAVNLGGLGYMVAAGKWRQALVRLNLATPVRGHSPAQELIVDRYSKLPKLAEGTATVFAGDSLVMDGAWSEFLTTVQNRGIGGERSDSLRDRIPAILAERPRELILLTGSNDLSQAVPEEQILRNYRTILEQISRTSPRSRVLVLGMLPCCPRVDPNLVYTNATVRAFNERLASLVREFPGDRYLDVAPALVDAGGDLRTEFARDGVHMTIDGYAAMMPLIRDALRLTGQPISSPTTSEAASTR